MLRGLLTTLTAAQLLVALAAANTYVVSPDGSGDFPTIQAAADAAQSGDVIKLSDGVFRGEGNRDIYVRYKSIAIESQNGPLTCMIDCEGVLADQHKAFALFMNSSRIKGITISNSYSGGAACSFVSGSPWLVECIFRNNVGNADGGAVCCDESHLTITDCWFEDNQAAAGGAIASCVGAEVLLNDCTLVNNRASSLGGAIRL